MRSGQWWDHPRIRGEHDLTCLLILEFAGSSPHTRGAPFVINWNTAKSRIIPAYAGSTASPHSGPCEDWDHPRIRGEHVDPITIGIGQWGSSPHTRGALGLWSIRCPSARIIPAYAGSTGVPSATACLAADHPRIRGEHDCSIYFTNFPTGSSPHTRGAPQRREVTHDQQRIIPAYAGSTARRRPHPRSPWDHPRIRGEHPRAPVTTVHGAGSSPHTRGARVQVRVLHIAGGIIPAYAGSTAMTSANITIQGDHPRIRGEHVSATWPPDPSRGSSPHTRGALIIFRSIAAFEGIIPAYAGSTLHRRRLHRPRQDHPRIRGEHPCLRARTIATLGSSPHTRGAHAAGRRSW